MAKSTKSKNNEEADDLNEDSEESSEKIDLPNSYFVDLIEKYGKPLITKARLPNAVSERNGALATIAAEILKERGTSCTPKRILTKFYNLKTRIKRKADVNRTGNRPIALLQPEQRLWDLLCADENPALTKSKCNEIQLATNID